MIPAPHPARRVAAALEPDRAEARVLRAKDGLPLVLRPCRAADGEALQRYVRGLSLESRYNRFFGAVSELPPAEMARALSANGRDRLTLLLASAHDPGTVIGEARVALSCAGRTGEVGLSIADGWQGLGVGSALLGEIERRAAEAGIARLFADVLRTNARMLALASGRGFEVRPGPEGRVARVSKRLDSVAPDLPCLKWAEAAAAP